MSHLKKALIVALIIIGLGTIAKGFNERRHMEMALTECGSQDNIANVNAKGFKCKSAP
ncbi:hypothetical protein [Thalassotalea sediminis]|uniref:hypothetical protein n=1 Tax=Thalassotalea sediminis TaxID=1759089 RepID=UPI0025736529|nr:hypothetical protein [Thalassotalea sediminis]